MGVTYRVSYAGTLASHGIHQSPARSHTSFGVRSKQALGIILLTDNLLLLTAVSASDLTKLSWDSMQALSFCLKYSETLWQRFLNKSVGISINDLIVLLPLSVSDEQMTLNLLRIHQNPKSSETLSQRVKGLRVKLLESLLELIICWFY